MSLFIWTGSGGILVQWTPFSNFFFIFEILAIILFSQRKNAEELKENLEKVVVPLFCKSFVGAEDNKKQKLTKVKLV